MDKIINCVVVGVAGSAALMALKLANVVIQF